MSHIKYGEEPAEQPQVTGDSVRNETAASIKGSHFIKRQIIWGRPNNPRAAATRSWPVWNGDKADLPQKGPGPESREKCAASHGISRTKAMAPCPAQHGHGTKLCWRGLPRPQHQTLSSRHVMPAHLGQRNRLMGDNQSLMGSLRAKLEIH